MQKLIVSRPGVTPREYQIADRLTIGRAAENDVQVFEPSVSSKHCCLRRELDGIVVEDLGSANGTRVNGEPVKTRKLKDGDKITLGKDTSAIYKAGAGDSTIRIAAAELSALLHEEPPAAPPSPPVPARRRISAPAVEELADETPVILPPVAAPHVVRAESAPVARPVAKDYEDRAPRSAAKQAPPKVQDNHLQGSKTVFLASVIALSIVALVAAVVVLVMRKPLPNTPPRQAEAARDDTASSQFTQHAEPFVPNTPTTTTPVAETPKTEPPPPQPTPVAEVPKTDVAAPPPAADEAALKDLFTQACARRDRALAAENYRLARLAMTTFCAEHPTGDIGARAREKLIETETVIETALSQAVDDAQKAATARDYRKATQRCTRLIALDQVGKFGSRAREILTAIDEQTKPRFLDFQAKATAQVKDGHLDQAAALLATACDELRGTCWSGQLSLRQTEMVQAQGLLNLLEAARAAKAAAGGPAPLLTSKKIKGIFTAVKGLKLEVDVDGAVMEVPIAILDPKEFKGLLDTFNLTDRHFELTCFWLVLDKRDLAQGEVEFVLRDARQAAAAVPLATAVGNLNNLHAYDFTNWQQQTDWDATAGSWSLQNERLVQDSPDGGDVALRAPTPIPARNLRVGFDFELLNPGEGYFFACEFGDTKHSVSTIFSATGLSLHGNVDAAVNAEEKWTAGLTHVDLAITGDILTVTVNGTALAPLTVAGLSGLSGSVAFHARQTACAIKNVILRNVQ